MNLPNPTVRWIAPLAAGLSFVAACAQEPARPAASPRAERPVLRGPTIGGCPVFPSDNVWNTPVDKLPLDPQSDKYIATIGRDKALHPDFGATGGGIPFDIIPGNQQHVRVDFAYRDESDLSNYPIPPTPTIEQGGDHHVLLVDKDNCVLWELFDVAKQSSGIWKAGSGAIYDLTCNCMRPAGWTSADAAGLPIFPGLVRYEEAAAGEIRHAIRFTVPQTRAEAVWPAGHFASKLTDQQYPPMGQRFRLKASVDISGYSREAQVVLRALQKYGMILADNGGAWFITGAPNPLWNDGALSQLKQITGKDFEAVDGFQLFVTHHSGRAYQGN
jgi:hypothetical protein